MGHSRSFRMVPLNTADSISVIYRIFVSVLYCFHYIIASSCKIVAVPYPSHITPNNGSTLNVSVPIRYWIEFSADCLMMGSVLLIQNIMVYASRGKKTSKTKTKTVSCMLQRPRGRFNVKFRQRISVRGIISWWCRT